MHIELRHLRYFLAVAEELNFSRAADRLHIAQPALSAQIRALEAQLGCELFTRTTRKVELTPNGKLLLKEAREIVARTDRAVAKLQAASRGERGLLRIGFAAHGAAEPGSAILRRFADEYPAIETELVQAATLVELQTQLLEDVTDVGFVWLPLLFEGLDAQPVLSERKVIAMQSDHALAGKRTVQAHDLISEPVVAPWEIYRPDLVQYWMGQFRPDGRRQGDPHALTIEESLTVVARGTGLYCMPESASRFFARPDVVFRPLLDAPPAEVAIAWATETRNPAVSSFVETARALLAEGSEDVAAIQSLGS